MADVLTSTATDAANRTVSLGYGALSLKSLANQVHFYAPAPQEASALTFDNEDLFATFGPVVTGYSLPGGCTISPCPANLPRASVYLFTFDRAPSPAR